MALITSQQLKTRTSIGGNVDPDKYMHLVNDAEVLVLEPILGTKLYNKIVSDLGDSSISGDYLTLYNNYIVPILCYTVYADFLNDNLIISMNTGVFENTPDDKTSADIENVKFVVKRNQSKADSYIQRLEGFLCDVDLPEYDNQDNNYDIDPQNVRTIAGWYLPATKTTEKQGIVLRGGGSSTTSEEMRSKTFIATSGQSDFVFASSSEAFSPVLVFEEQGLVLGWTYNPLNLTITLPNPVLVAGSTITVTG